MIAILGISHQSAPVSVREIYAFDQNQKIKFAEQIKHKLQIEGTVILSTCNRTEIYINTRLDNEIDIYSILTGELNSFMNASGDHKQYFYFFAGEKAIEQIFKVASGLESLILGEEQILGQVKEAFRQAQTSKLTDCILSRLFIKAIEAGKRVRTETHLNKGAASVSYAAIELCYEIFPDLESRTVMMIGAGQTGDLVLQCLLKKNQPAFYIANRTFSKAEELAERYSGTALELTSVESVLPDCDIIITATSSKEHIITRSMAEKSSDQRNQKLQVYIDLSVPSNIDEKVKDAGNIKLFGVDDLREVIVKNVERRRSAIDHSMEIINEVQTEFMEWIDIQNLIPTIISIKENLKNIQQTELEGFIKYRKIKEHDLIEQYSEHISEKYTEIFIKKLKQVTDNGKRPEYIKVINDLFEHI